MIVRLGIGILFIAVCLAPPAGAQVISGESTYEDNFFHTPPAEAEKPANRDPASKPDPTGSAQRDLRARDRD